MAQHRPLPGQRLLFDPPELKQLERLLPQLSSTALWRHGQVVGAEIIRRRRQPPLALELGLRMSPPAIDAGVPVG